VKAILRWPGPHRLVLLLSITLARAGQAAPGPTLLTETPGPADFILASGGQVAAVWCDPMADKAVKRAAGDLAADLERVTGHRPALVRDAAPPHGFAVLIGVLGHSPLIDGLAKAGRLDVQDMRGAWESGVLQVVDRPAPGLDHALVIAGSDRRGAIYGIYTLCEAIGVSPWYWWADVPVKPRAALAIRAGVHRQGPPSVKYRGIFLNDEDWGLQPWAAKTFEPGLGDIGPKTYARIFELLLRLKANTLWPAMHACTKAFNLYPPSRQVADDYGIVMGSSHAEPMLRNNVTEWTAPHEDYDYLRNRDGVRAYWEQRARENGRFENIYTLGMRGIHDSAIQGPTTDAERVQVLEQIFADQRALLAQYVNPDVSQVPQAFTPYKEVLDIYRAGLRVPDDVTLVWPDDNFGYIRHVPTADEQKRRGGSGVYYHLSYLGSPLSYLWLETTPPALIWEEMSKAYDYGARTIWIANVGDLKPAEIGTEFFLQMAWDIHRWRRDNLPGFLAEWAAREFGPAPAGEIAAILGQYYQLNFQRKPEHLQWWLRDEPPRPSPLAEEEARRRLEAFAVLRAQVDRLRLAVPAATKDAFDELVAYPVRGSALANERYFCGEISTLHQGANQPDATSLARQAQAADARLREETRIFNEETAGGKWRGILALEPADGQWRSIRLAPWQLPRFAVRPPLPVSATTASATPPPGFDGFVETDGVVSIEAGHCTGKVDRRDVAWEVVPGLGRTGRAVAAFPTTAASLEPIDLITNAPRLDYRVCFASTGEFPLYVDLLPVHPIGSGTNLRFAVALDEETPQVVTVSSEVGSRTWAQGVLNGVLTASARLRVPTGGGHVLRIFMVDPGVVLDKLVVDAGGLGPSYLGPPETRRTK